MNIQEIKEITGKGYIDDPKMIERAIDSFLETPLSELSNMMDPKYRYNFPGFINVYYDYSEESLKTISVADAICLAESIKDVDGLNFIATEGMGKWEYQKLFYHCLTTMLTNVQYKSSVLKRFFSISLNALFEYYVQQNNRLEMDYYISDMEECNKDIVEFAHWNQESIFKEDITLGAAVNELAEVKKRSWNCSTPVCKYQRVILSADRMQTTILYDLIFEALRDRMNYAELSKRLYSIEWEDFCFDEFEFFDEKESGKNG